MKRVIIATAITALFSTMATANSGLADRINEARSYPNKEISTKMTYTQDKQSHKTTNKLDIDRKGNS